MVFPQRFLFSMGLAGVMVALIAAGIALLVLPAVLALLGRRINSGAPGFLKRGSEHADEAVTSGFWYRLSNAVMRRPGDRRGHHGHGAGDRRPAGLQHQLHLGRRERAPHERDRPPGVGHHRRPTSPTDVSQPIYLAIDAPDTPEARAELTAYAQRLRALPDAALVTPPAVVGDEHLAHRRLRDAPASTSPRQDLVAAMRDTPAPYPTLVGGLSASFVDQKDEPRGAPAVGHHS